MMNLGRWAASGLAVMVFAVAPDVGAQASSAFYGVSYIEVQPSAREAVRGLLRNLRTESAKAGGHQSVEVFQRIDRNHHFAIVEIWSDESAYKANATSAHGKAFRDRLKPLLIAGLDERLHVGFEVVTNRPNAAPGAIYGITHVDFIPPRKDDGLAAIKQVVGPSRADAGNVRYDVFQQSNRPNHLTVVEAWRDMAALEAHEIASHFVAFRDVTLPMSGALFDQRLYRLID